MEKQGRFEIKFYTTLITLIILLVVDVLFSLNTVKNTMLKDTVKENQYISNTTDKTSFDWFIKSVGIDKVPSYLVIKDKKVVGTIKKTANITTDDFDNQFNSIIKENEMSEDLSDLSFGYKFDSKLDLVKTNSIKLSEDTQVIELYKIGCPYCNKYSQKALSKYVNKNYKSIRYYTNSTSFSIFNSVSLKSFISNHLFMLILIICLIVIFICSIIFVIIRYIKNVKHFEKEMFNEELNSNDIDMLL